MTQKWSTTVKKSCDGWAKWDKNVRPGFLQPKSCWFEVWCNQKEILCFFTPSPIFTLWDFCCFFGFFFLRLLKPFSNPVLALLAISSSSTNRFRGMLIPLKLTSCFHCSVHRDYLYPFRFGTTSWQLNDYLQQLLKTFPSNEQMKNPDLNSCSVTNSSSISVLVPEQWVRDMYKM